MSEFGSKANEFFKLKNHDLGLQKITHTYTICLEVLKVHIA